MARHEPGPRHALNEHPAPTGAGVLDAPTVESALHADCQHAAYLGEASDLSVVAAMSHAL